MIHVCDICNRKFNNPLSLGGHKSSHSRFPGMMNKSKAMVESACLNCNVKIFSQGKRKFCSLKCNGQFQHKNHNARKSKIVKYGKTILFLEDYRKKNPKCEICGNNESVLIKKKKIQLAYDHDHETNTFRGMLCFMCNTRYDWYLRNIKNIQQYVNKELP